MVFVPVVFQMVFVPVVFSICVVFSNGVCASGIFNLCGVFARAISMKTFYLIWP